jgi:oxygen-dependent protoporphyrinogen oxidase
MIGTLDKTRREVTVVGAGIAGLLAAYALDRAGYEVTLLESAPRAGGLIQTRRNEYGIAETAAHSLLITPPVADFCRALGVELLDVRKDSRARFILRNGKLRKFPLTVGEAARTLARAAFKRAPRQPEAQTSAQTLDAWGRTHLGDAAVEYLLTPFVRGIYGVQPGELGLAAAFPELTVAPGRTLLGTFLRKSIGGTKKNGHAANGNGHAANGNGRAVNGNGRAATNGDGAAAQPEANGQAKERKRMVAPRGGMGDVAARLEKHLEARLGARFRRGVNVTEIPDAPNVVLATPAYVAAQLLEEAAPELSRQLEAIKYTPLVAVTAFVARDALTRPVKGVGVLAAPGEGRKCLGILFNSSAFAGRVSDEARYASFTILFGGSAQPRWLAATDEEIAAAVREELAAVLGIRGVPLKLVITRQPRGVPQYTPELPQLWQTARATWCALPGRVLFGNYTGQVSLRGLIESARALG